MTKIFPHCTISVGLAPLADYIYYIYNYIYIYKYRENSDNSTDKGGSLRSPIIVRASFRKCTAFPFLRRYKNFLYARGVHSKFKGAF